VRPIPPWSPATGKYYIISVRRALPTIHFSPLPGVWASCGSRSGVRTTSWTAVTCADCRDEDPERTPTPLELQRPPGVAKA